jgi:hypothetical protein
VTAITAVGEGHCSRTLDNIKRQLHAAVAVPITRSESQTRLSNCELVALSVGFEPEPSPRTVDSL